MKKTKLAVVFCLLLVMVSGKAFSADKALFSNYPTGGDDASYAAEVKDALAAGATLNDIFDASQKAAIDPNQMTSILLLAGVQVADVVVLVDNTCFYDDISEGLVRVNDLAEKMGLPTATMEDVNRAKNNIVQTACALERDVDTLGYTPPEQVRNFITPPRTNPNGGSFASSSAF